MKIAVFGRNFNESFEVRLAEFFNRFSQISAEIYIYEPFYEYIKLNTKLNPVINDIFNNQIQITLDFDFIFSFGGDGTFLETVTYIRDKNIPIIGINTGRLGFLANIAPVDLSHSIDLILNNSYKIEERNLISFDTINNPFSEFPYALNEIVIQKNENSMVSIHTKIDGVYVNTYWTDGLIISTPTGSTAYSMSSGGPIVTPDCNLFIIAPIAPHNLSVRPIVITNNHEITINVETRNSKFFASLDSRFHNFPSGVEIKIKLANFNIKMLRLYDSDFFQTLRNKLMWGVDKRN